MTLIYILISLSLLANIILLYKIFNKSGTGSEPETISFLNQISQQLQNISNDIKQEFSLNRKESTDASRDMRAELSEQLNKFILSFSEQQKNLTLSNDTKLETIRKTLEEKLAEFQKSIETNNKEGRSELKENLELFKKELHDALRDYKERLREQFGEFEKNQTLQNNSHIEKISELRTSLEKSVKTMQEGNEKKLEEMRITVDEKLQKTLEARLSASFELVSKNLESVQKGLGEMQTLAVGVGDLKKVLSNVKTRGILGEIQLSNILEQLLAPEQYEINTITKKGTNNRVEFAIRIPQQNQNNNELLMPIDSKFPLEDYYTLLSAFEANDAAAAETAGKSLEMAIKKSAKDIHEKYISPPDTTDIGLLFLPIEGLYAEAVRRPALLEFLQREYQIIVTGPTTLSAILHTISFGYKTMALEQRSGEIQHTLKAVKTEFGKFGEVLKKTQEKLNKASDDLEELVGTRTRKINAKLKSFEELPAKETEQILGSADADSDES